MDNRLILNPENSSENPAHAFVIRVWLEEVAPETDEPLWRGHITHVISGRRQYFQKLEQVLPFIRSFLQLERRNIG